MAASFQELANFIWSIADLLRGPYRPPQYERVMLPLTVLRRFDAVLAPTKQAVLQRYAALEAVGKAANADAILNTLARDKDGNSLGFHNRSKLDFAGLKADPDTIGHNLRDYLAGFSSNVRDIFLRHFDFEREIERLEAADRLYLIVSQFAEIELQRFDNIEMGLLFEDLIRRFNEAANETAGDHFTPREVIRLMVNLLLAPDEAMLTGEDVVARVYDPACGTGGMLSEAENWIREHNEGAHVFLFGQDYNPRSYAIAASDLLIKGQPATQIQLGNTLTHDPFADQRFDYLLANPPFGVDWKAEKKEIDRRGRVGTYEGKLPRVNDGALLFLLGMIGKFVPPEDGGSRAAVVFNGSPLFTGGAASGESEIRRWLIEHDLLEAVVALPEQMFYNTGIGTFIWVVTNRKAPERQGKLQLIDARERWTPMRRSLGDKRRYLTDDAIDLVTREHGERGDTETSRVFDSADFGYRRITVERPLRLRFAVTERATGAFLASVPEALDVVREIEGAFGTAPHDDWNAVWAEVEEILRAAGEQWNAPQQKLFRALFTTPDPTAAPVVRRRGPAKWDADGAFPGQPPHGLTAKAVRALVGLYPEPEGKKGHVVEYEPDPALRDAERVPLRESVAAYFAHEVAPYWPDAWIARDGVDAHDGGLGAIGYEINVNRVFFRYTPPRDPAEIDKELAAVERRVLELLGAVAA